TSLDSIGGNASSPTENLPIVIGRTPATVNAPGSSSTPAPAGTIEPGRVDVIDGDTVRVDGKNFRLVGIDTPEIGVRARCETERQLALRAAKRLREIVAGGTLRLDRVACSDCPPGTEGTLACNYGRLCGVLTVSGRDVGLILIGEGLA